MCMCVLFPYGDLDFESNLAMTSWKHVNEQKGVTDVLVLIII